jgi:hypothetical protein
MHTPSEVDRKGADHDISGLNGSNVKVFHDPVHLNPVCLSPLSCARMPGYKIGRHVFLCTHPQF